MSERCYGITGRAGHPAFCGYKAKAEDAMGRPCCGHHLGKQEIHPWEGARGHYPFGTRGYWDFSHGESRVRS